MTEGRRCDVGCPPGADDGRAVAGRDPAAERLELAPPGTEHRAGRRRRRDLEIVRVGLELGGRELEQLPPCVLGREQDGAPDRGDRLAAARERRARSDRRVGRDDADLLDRDPERLGDERREGRVRAGHVGEGADERHAAVVVEPAGRAARCPRRRTRPRRRGPPPRRTEAPCGAARARGRAAARGTRRVPRIPQGLPSVRRSPRRRGWPCGARAGRSPGARRARRGASRARGRRAALRERGRRRSRPGSSRRRRRGRRRPASGRRRRSGLRRRPRRPIRARRRARRRCAPRGRSARRCSSRRCAAR